MKRKTGMRAFSLLLALVLVSVGVVSAVSAQDIYRDDTAYFSKIQPSEEVDGVHFTNLPLSQEYELVTVIPSLFAADASSGKSVAVNLLGKEYLLDLEPVPAPVAKDAKCVVVNESGTFILDPPLIECYVGTVSGDPESYAFFTVDNEVILGTIRTGDVSYVIEQVGIVGVGSERRVVHAIYDDYSVADVKEPLAHCGVVPLERVASEIPAQLPSGALDVQSGTTATTTVTMMAAHDHQFRNLFPSPNTEMANMIAQINTAFSPSDIGVSLQVNAYCDLGTTLTAYNHESLLRDFSAENAALRDRMNSDIAVLFTG